MSDETNKAYTEWQEADAAARAAERRLQAGWLAYDMGGPAPSQALLADVSRLRSIANDKLNLAMSALTVAKESSNPDPGSAGNQAGKNPGSPAGVKGS